jgi:HD-GYP domain-containing protein (c-di-GMP phosphodiesterase class II)
LNKEEWGLMKSHPYYSYYVLDNIVELPKLKEWSAYHHEKLDGTGYPFRLDKSKLSIGARIMAVSDIFTALAEDRPYRPGLDKNHIIKILKEEAHNKKIDKRMVSLLTDDFEKFNETRNKKQQRAIINYNEFKEKISDEIFNIYQSSTA